MSSEHRDFLNAHWATLIRPCVKDPADADEVRRVTIRLYDEHRAKAEAAAIRPFGGWTLENGTWLCRSMSCKIVDGVPVDIASERVAAPAKKPRAASSQPKGYYTYLRKHTEEYMNENAGATKADAKAALGARWKSMTSEQQKPYKNCPPSSPRAL
jgi:hypothetical protein